MNRFFGVLVLLGLPAVGRLYAASLGQGFPGILLRGLLCGVFLLPPTLRCKARSMRTAGSTAVPQRDCARNPA